VKKTLKEPETAMGKLMQFVNELELVLHPRVIHGLKQAVWDARTEMAQDAKNQVFSKEMQELELFLERFRGDIVLYTAGGATPRFLWQMRPLLAKIIELYGNGSQNIPEKL
jgi:hypothetical protein